MGKKTIKAIAVPLESGSEHVTLTVSESVSPEKTPETTSEMIAKEDSADMVDKAILEQKRAINRAFQHNDAMTQYLMKKFKLAYMWPELRYTDSRFPRTEDGKVMSVNRFYPAMNLVVDKIPESWTEDMIRAKKWAIEQLGMTYFWIQDGEKVELLEDGIFLNEGYELVEHEGKNENQIKRTSLENRFKKVKTEPKFLFKSMVPGTQFLGPRLGLMNAASALGVRA